MPKIVDPYLEAQQLAEALELDKKRERLEARILDRRGSIESTH